MGASDLPGLRWLKIAEGWIKKARSYNPDLKFDVERGVLQLSFYVDYRFSKGRIIKHLVVLRFVENPLYKAPETSIYRMKGRKPVDITHELPCHVIGGKPCIMSDDVWVSIALPHPDGPVAFAMLQAAAFIRDFYEEDEGSFCSKTVF